MIRLLTSGLLAMVLGLVFFLGLARSGAAEPVAVDAPPGASAPAPKIPEAEEALSRFGRRDFDGARNLLREAVKKHPELSPARVMMASLFARVNQIQPMRAELEAAVVETPDDPEAYQFLGDLARQGGRVTEADLCYERAAELVQKLPDGVKRKDSIRKLTSLGRALVADARNDWPKAQKFLDECLAVDPKNAGALLQYGRALFKQKKTDEALEKLKAAARADPATLTPEAIMATFYQQEGDSDGARKMMVAALNLAPKDMATRLVAADWALGTGQLATAEQQADVALQLDPNRAEAVNLCGVVALHKKDYAKAAEMFQKLVTQSPANFAATNNLALALIELDDASRRKAFEYAKANVERAPNQPNLLSTWGWVLYKAGRLDEAEAALRRSLEVSVGQNIPPDTVYYMARVAADRKRLDQARGLLEFAMQAKVPFSMRPEAAALLKQLGKSSEPSSTKTSAPVEKPAEKPVEKPASR